MSLHNRALARAGAGVLGLLAVGAFALPAAAADSTSGDAADVSLDAVAGTIATGAPGKFTKIDITNHSHRVAARDILVTLDLRDLDQAKVRFNGFKGEGGPVCTPEPDRISCRATDPALPAGTHWGWFFPIERVAGATGNAGHIRATVTHRGADPRRSNDSARLRIRVHGDGPDLYAVADDADKVFHIDSDGTLHWEGPLHPGDIGTVLFMTVNQGDTPTTGMRITITLPRGVAFADADGPHGIGCQRGPGGCTPDRCVYSADNRTVVCAYDHFPLIPTSQDTNPDDDLVSKQGFFHRIRVCPEVTSPAVLSGGSLHVEPRGGAAAGRDVDASDNTDEFAAIVA